MASFKTEIKDINPKDYYKYLLYYMNKANIKIDNIIKNNKGKENVLNRLNRIMDRANYVTSGEKLVGNGDAFLTHDENGVPRFKRNKKFWESLNLNQQKAFLKSFRNLNIAESYGQKTLSVKGMDSFFDRSESKMRATIRSYMNANEMVIHCRKNGIDIESALQMAEDRTVQRIYQCARNKEPYSSEQIAEEEVERALQEVDINEIIREQLDDINNNTIERGKQLDDFINGDSNNIRGGDLR